MLPEQYFISIYITIMDLEIYTVLENHVRNDHRDSTDKWVPRPAPEQVIKF